MRRLEIATFENIGGQVGKGGMAVMIGLTMHVPGEVPDLGIDVPQEASLAHLFLEEGAADGGEGVHGDKEIGAGGAPESAILGEATARNDVADVGMILELPAPGDYQRWRQQHFAGMSLTEM